MCYNIVEYDITNIESRIHTWLRLAEEGPFILWLFRHHQSTWQPSRCGPELQQRADQCKDQE